MSRIRGRDTKPELLVRRLVHWMGYRYRLHKRDLPGKPDLVFASRRRVIFVHGCYWHMHDCRFGRVRPVTRAEFWQAKRMRTVERDARALSSLERTGWSSLVIWECEVKSTDLETRLRRFLDGEAD